MHGGPAIALFEPHHNTPAPSCMHEVGNCMCMEHFQAEGEPKSWLSNTYVTLLIVRDQGIGG